MTHEFTFTVWGDDQEDADRISDKLDELQAEYGSGKYRVLVGIMPSERPGSRPEICGYDSVYLNDNGMEVLQAGEIVTKGI